jgi:hypothetical protein
MFIKIVPKNQIWPKLATWDLKTKERLISDVVPKWARLFFDVHEWHHTDNKETNESVLEEEVEANIWGFLFHPLGALWALYFTIFNKERREYYRMRAEKKI